MLTIEPISCQKAMYQVSKRFPYRWDANPYRGCQHQCRYCYALYSHRYLGSDDFYHHIYVKTNFVTQLEKQLASPRYQKAIINFGGVSDSYQPAEAKYQIMPEVWKLMIRYQNPVIICTKSDLILRDLPLIQQLAQCTYVSVAVTITTLDERVAKAIEPGAPSPARRLEVLRQLKQAGILCGLHIMPIVPYFTDQPRQLEALCNQAATIGVDYVLPGIMYLRGLTRTQFFDFVKTEFPALLRPLQELYQKGKINPDYRRKLYQLLPQYIQKYHLNSDYQKLIPPSSDHQQLTFFDEKGNFTAL